jgi:hypothetical protein
MCFSRTFASLRNSATLDSSIEILSKIFTAQGGFLYLAVAAVRSQLLMWMGGSDQQLIAAAD